MTSPTDSPPLTLYYSPRACSLASHIVLEESGLPFRAVSINIRAGENRMPAYLAVNPTGSVPALGIGDAVVTESQAIMTHVADQVPERELLPRPGTLARARAHEWMSWISGSLHGAFRSVFRSAYYAGEESEAAQQAVRAQGHASLVRLFGTLEQRLGEAPAPSASSFSAVDAYLFVFYLWSFDERLPGPIPARPRLAALAERVWARDGARAAVARERLVRPYAMPAPLDAGTR